MTSMSFVSDLGFRRSRAILALHQLMTSQQLHCALVCLSNGPKYIIFKADVCRDRLPAGEIGCMLYGYAGAFDEGWLVMETETEDTSPDGWLGELGLECMEPEEFETLESACDSIVPNEGVQMSVIDPSGADLAV